MTLLDTGVWFRYFHRLPLHAGVISYLKDNPPLYLSSISVWEIATKHRNAKLPCPPLSEWLESALADYWIVPVTEEIARMAGEDSMNHQDPADRLIIATARSKNLVLLHTDRRIRVLKGFRQRFRRGVS